MSLHIASESLSPDQSIQFLEVIQICCPQYEEPFVLVTQPKATRINFNYMLVDHTMAECQLLVPHNVLTTIGAHERMSLQMTIPRYYGGARSSRSPRSKHLGELLLFVFRLLMFLDPFSFGEVQSLSMLTKESEDLAQLDTRVGSPAEIQEGHVH